MEITIKSKESGRNVHVSNFDDGAFINISGRGFSAYTALDMEETLQLIEILQTIVKQKEPT